MDNDNVITPSQLLVKAKEILETRGWGQGLYAKTSAGNTTEPMNPKAVCFCGVGAILRAAGINYRYSNDPALRRNEAVEGAIKCLESVVGSNVPRWNDVAGRTKGEVLEAFDKATLICP